MPSYEELTQTIRGFQESRAILTALELDLFTLIGSGARAADVAKRAQTDARATELLLNALVSLALLRKDGDRFLNSDLTSRYFAGGSRDDQRMATLHTAQLWHKWSTLTDAVKAGTAVAPRDNDPIATEAFIAAMHRNAAERAPHVLDAVDALGVHNLLDLGGGSGAYSIAFAQANTELRATIVDQEAVLAIAQRHIQSAGLTGRIRTEVGDLLRDTFGSGYDLALLSAICHMFSPEENVDLFRRAYAALAPRGRLAIQDFILEPDKTAPRFAAMFALNMLVNTRGGASYSAEEYAAWLKQAGFERIRHVRLPGPTGVMIGERTH